MAAHEHEERQPMTARFTDRAVLVTGGGMGMGEAAARAFAAEGAGVGVFDLDADAAEAVTKAIANDGGRAIAIAGDVRRGDDASRAVRATAASFGGLDVLVNNAGVNRYGEVPDLAESDWDLVLDTNVKGPFLMAKHAIPAMRRRGGGAIVNLASVQAFATQPTVAAYAASKGAVVSMTATMALDHAKDGIRVNCIAPGSVLTPMLREAAVEFHPDDPEAGLRAWGQQHPIGFLTEPEDVAKLILFLASDDARTITGGCYRIDGGLLAKLGI
jgi:NAD(P)-dependent dehydrogenase (short-subunit alcohol dehydrogenase family)